MEMSSAQLARYDGAMALTGKSDSLLLACYQTNNEIPVRRDALILKRWQFNDTVNMMMRSSI